MMDWILWLCLPPGALLWFWLIALCLDWLWQVAKGLRYFLIRWTPPGWAWEVYALRKSGAKHRANGTCASPSTLLYWVNRTAPKTRRPRFATRWVRNEVARHIRLMRSEGCRPHTHY